MPEISFINFAVDSFFIQILFISLLFCYGLQRRRYFYLRLAGTSVACLAWFFLVPRIPVFGLFNLSFILIFIAVTLIIKFCFVIRFYRILFYNIASASLQNIVAKTVTLLGFTGAPAFAERTIPQLLITCALFAVVAVAFFFLYVKKTKSVDPERTGRLRFGVLLLISILVVFILSPLCDALVNEAAGRVLCLLLIMLADLMVLLAEFGVFEGNRIVRENYVIENMLRMQRDQRERSAENTAILERKCHDMRHQIEMLRAQANSESESAKYADELEASVRAFESSVETGNRALDVVLNEYLPVCQARGIRFTYMADGAALSFMSSADIYGFFGNALENAVDALTKIEDETQRLLELSVSRKGVFAEIRIENACPEEPTFRGGLPVTSKQENGMHGFGIRSMKYIVEKYGGTFKASWENGTFSLYVAISCAD